MTYPLHSGTEMKGFLDGFSFYCCDKYHYQKQHEKERVYDILKFIVYSPSLMKVREGTKGSLEAGTGANTTKEHCLLACFHGLPSLLSYTIHDHQPKDGSISVSCTLPH